MNPSMILLWLFVINLGIAFGAGLYEQRMILPQWFNPAGSSGFRVDSEAMRQSDPGRRFWAYVTTGPLTLLTLANLAAALRSDGPGHPWWLAAAGIILVERTGTFVFFIPTAIKLMRAETQPPSVVERTARRWLRLNYVRNALGLAGWLAALKTLSLAQ